MAYLGNAPARSFISFERQVFTIVNSQTAYALSHSVANENDIRLVVNNVVQEPGSGKAYTATGTALTLSAALTNGTDEMYCVFLGRATATSAPGAGSIGTAQLASDSVTLAKMASGTDGNIISYDASGNPVAVATGSAGQILTSAGAGAPPTFSAAGLDGWSSNSGNLLPADASKGIYLGVNSATAANLLDDYEEGDWTPVINNSGVAQLSMTNNGAYYTKIGRMVYLTATLRYTGSTLSSGATIIGANLPFTAAAGAPLGCSGTFIHDPGSGNSNYIAGICGAQANSTNYYFIITPGGRYLDKMYNNYYFQFAFNYRV